MCFPGFITLDRDTPSKSGLYVTGLPGVTLAQIDGVTKDEQSDMEEAFEYLYALAQTNLKIDLQRALANKFHIDRNIVSRETSKFLATVNSSSDLSGVTIEYLRSKYSRLHISTVQVYLDSPIFSWIASELPHSAAQGVAYGNNTYVSVGGDTEVGSIKGGAWSEDGVNWTLSDLSSTRIWKDVTFAEHLNLFVAVSPATGSTATQRIATSPDGKTWTLRTTADDLEFIKIASGNDLIIAIDDGTDGEFIMSADGITWTTETMPVSTPSGIVFGDGKFVVVGEFGIQWTTDGLIWHSVDFGTGTGGGIVYTNGVFLCDRGDALYRSVDAVTWTEVDIGIATIEGMFGGGGVFIVQPSGSALNSIASSDGVHWSTVNGGRSFTAAGFGNGRIVSVGTGAGAAMMVMNQEIPGFGTIFVYQDDEDGELLGSFSLDTVVEGKNTVVIDQDFDADKIFVAINPVGYFRKTENKYFGYDSLSADKLSCTFPCGFGRGSVTQVNDGGLNVAFNVYCSFDKLICDNLNIFKYALWYRIGVDLMKERQISDRVTRFTVLSPERTVELMTVFNEDYKAALDAAVMNLKLTEDTQCFVCKKPIKAVTSLP